MINSDNIFPVVAVATGGLVMLSAGAIIAFSPTPNENVRDLIFGGTSLAALGGTAYKYTDPQKTVASRAAKSNAKSPV